MDTIKTTHVVTSKKQLPIYQMDVKLAFLNRDSKEECYYEELANFQQPRSKEMVYKLEKALYDLNKAPHAWNDKIDSFFKKTSFIRPSTNPNLFIDKKTNFAIIFVYMNDDLIITNNQTKFLNATKATWWSEF